MKKARFLVIVDIPEGSSVKEVQDYIREEVKVGCGAKSPEDPIYRLNRDSVKVFCLSVNKVKP